MLPVKVKFPLILVVLRFVCPTKVERPETFKLFGSATLLSDNVIAVAPVLD